MENDRSFVGRVAKQRQRFTPWLVEQIERGDIDGLEWIDKDQGKFRVPWVRVDKPEFQLETHAELFKRWAQHTGKYRPGDQPDPSTWKTRFRCALRKMQEIVEIKDQGNLEGNKPHRVFKFEPKLKEGNCSSRRSSRRLQRSRRSSSSSESISSTEAYGSMEQVIQGYSTHAGMNEWENPHGQNTQYPILRDMLEPAPIADWDMWDMSIYFPEGIESQFGFSAGSSYGFRDQEPSNHFGLQACAWPSCVRQEGYNAAMYNEVASYTVPQLMP